MSAFADLDTALDTPLGIGAELGEHPATGIPGTRPEPPSDGRRIRTSRLGVQVRVKGQGREMPP